MLPQEDKINNAVYIHIAQSYVPWLKFILAMLKLPDYYSIVTLMFANYVEISFVWNTIA
jgi:hypothetical protein